MNNINGIQPQVRGFQFPGVLFGGVGGEQQVEQGVLPPSHHQGSGGPYCSVLYHVDRAVPHHAMPFCTITFHTIPLHAIPYQTVMSYHTIPHHTMSGAG